MLQNQHDMIEKLNDIESRLLDLESRCTVNQRNSLKGNNGHSIRNNNNNSSNIINSHHLLYHKLNNNSHHYNNINYHKNNNNNNNHNNSEANNSEANNSDNNSTNNNNFDYDVVEEQDFNNDEGTNNNNNNNNNNNDYADTYNDNNESMGSNNDSLEYNDQSQQSLNVSNSFSTNPNINVNDPNLLNETEVQRIFSIAKSRGNFAALVVQQLYAKHERIISNVMGTRGKRQLSPRRISIVKKLTFNMYPGATHEEEEMLWKKECVKAIDSKNRKVKILPGSVDHMNLTGIKFEPTKNIKFDYQMN